MQTDGHFGVLTIVVSAGAGVDEIRTLTRTGLPGTCRVEFYSPLTGGGGYGVPGGLMCQLRARHRSHLLQRLTRLISRRTV